MQSISISHLDFILVCVNKTIHSVIVRLLCLLHQVLVTADEAVSFVHNRYTINGQGPV